MKLGILVVYLVNENDEKLLDLHLNQIEKHTKVPYTIYGSVNRLYPTFKEKLKHHPHVKICDCHTTDLRSHEEHSFYLEKLLRIAIEDGMSHIAVLHVDSFPVRTGWAEELAGKLTDTCVMASIVRDEQFDKKPVTACMFFHRDFYLKYHPTFLLSHKELDSADYKKYQKKHKHIIESGVGFGFRIYSAGLSWHKMLRSNKNEGHYYFSSIYDDSIFHLGAAAHDDRGFPGNRDYIAIKKIIKIFRKLLPQSIKNIFRALIPDCIAYPEKTLHQTAFHNERMKLLNNPESYLIFLRTNEK